MRRAGRTNDNDGEGKRESLKSGAETKQSGKEWGRLGWGLYTL